MLLSRLAHDLPIHGPDRDITSITEDSRRIGPGGLFVAIAGMAEDGHDYVSDAVRRGAAAIVGERVDEVPVSVARIQVPDSRAALAILASRFYEEPASELELVGFTGTFGKTSTSEVLRALLSAAGTRTGVLGSLGARYEEFYESSHGLTTPAPVELHRALRALRGAGADRVIMEVTSHALRLRRVAGLAFSGGLLAAITPGEHTDFHRTYEDYVDAKRVFLQYLSQGATLAYDADNRTARELAAVRQDVRAAGFSFDGQPAALAFREPQLDADGARFRLEGPLAGGRVELRSALLGSGHLRNVALALTYALAAGVELSTASQVLQTLRPLPRRMERFSAAGRTVLDDTAAHPQSFEAALEVAALFPHRRLAVVYAVRGNRGVEINRQNAESLAELCARHTVDTLILTSSVDAVGEVDRVSPLELEAARHALSASGRAFVAHDSLADAVREALERTREGDLIVLLGAQGMNQGKRLLLSSTGTSART